MTENDLLDIAVGQVVAYNNRDFDKFSSLVDPEFIFNEMPTGRIIHGIEQFRLIWDTWTTAFPDNYGEVINSFIASGNRAVLEIKWSGTHKGTLVTPEKEIPPTGKKFSNGAACQIVDVEKGKVIKINHYFDILTVLNQLGVV